MQGNDFEDLKTDLRSLKTGLDLQSSSYLSSAFFIYNELKNKFPEFSDDFYREKGFGVLHDNLLKYMSVIDSETVAGGVDGEKINEEAVEIGEMMEEWGEDLIETAEFLYFNEKQGISGRRYLNEKYKDNHGKLVEMDKNLDEIKKAVDG